MSNNYPSSVVSQLLTNPRYEVLPTASIEESIHAHVPTGTILTVTASPAKPIAATVDLATSLQRAGYEVVPHLAARMISGRGELGEIVAQLREADITRVFVPAGDAKEPAGDYPGSLELLRDLRDLGDPFAEVSITGYPESHPTIDDDITIQAMWAKHDYATSIISNMTFSDASLSAWLERIRRRGVTLPVYVGVPGPVDRAKLIGMATKIGVGDSVRFLKKQKGVFARIAAPGFGTESFVGRVGALAANPQLGVAGLHIFTFNQVEATEKWRTAMLAEASTP